MIVGAEMLRLAQELDIFLMEAWGGLEGILASGWSRHHASWSAMSTASRAEDMVSIRSVWRMGRSLMLRLPLRYAIAFTSRPILLLADADQDVLLS